MSECIWKSSLRRDGVTDVYFGALPKGARPLSAGFQNGDFVVWSLVNPDQPLTRRRHFLIAPTGVDLGDSADAGEFLNRVEIPDGARPLIFHAFLLPLQGDE